MTVTMTMTSSLSRMMCLMMMTSIAHATENYQLSEQTTNMRARTESIQWISESITVLSKDDIESTFRRTLEDLDGYIPGMVFDTLGSTPQGAAIAIRGIHSNRASKGFEPAVAVMMDGVYVGTHTGQNQTLFDIERIEVRRGTQGTFTAAPAEAGAIYIERTKPTGVADLTIRLGLGDYSRKDLDAVLNLPMIYGIATKITGSFLESDNEEISNVSGREENTEERTAISLSFLWDQREDISIQYTYDTEDDRSDTPALINFSTLADLVCVPDPTDILTTANCSNPTTSPGLQPESGSLEFSTQNFSNRRKFEGRYHTLRIEGEFNGFKYTSITGYRATDEKFDQDLDGTSTDFYSSTFDQDYEQLSSEFTVLGQWSDNLTYVVGGYLFNTKYDLIRNDLFILNKLQEAGRLEPGCLDPPACLSDPEIVRNQTRTIDSSQDASITSIFGHADYFINDQWSADFGLRFNRYEKEFVQIVSPIATVTSPGTNLLLRNDEITYRTSGSAGLRFKVDESAMIYFRYGVDYTPAGFYDNATSAESASFHRVQTTQSLEIGMKSHWYDDRLRLNFSYFQNYQDDKVEEFTTLTSAGNFEATADNISQIEVTGFDLEFEYVPLTNLYFRGAYGHTNASYRDYDVADLANAGQVLDLSSIVDPARSPSDTLYITGQYFTPVAEGVLHLFVGYKFVQGYETNPLLTRGTVRSYATLDLSAEYRINDFTIRLFSQNAIDKRYLTSFEGTNDAQIASISANQIGWTADPALCAIQGISTIAEVNRPRYTGIEVIWKPQIRF